MWMMVGTAPTFGWQSIAWTTAGQNKSTMHGDTYRPAVSLSSVYPAVPGCCADVCTASPERVSPAVYCITYTAFNHTIIPLLPLLINTRQNQNWHDCCRAELSRLRVIHTDTHSILTAIFPGEPGLSVLNSPSPFIPGLRILLVQA